MMLKLFVLTLLMLPLHLFCASAHKISQKQYCPGILNQHGVMRFENNKKIRYSTYGECCTYLKEMRTYKHKDLNQSKRSDHSFCSRRFAALKQQFEGK